jgi:hypothetical protein
MILRTATTRAFRVGGGCRWTCKHPHQRILIALSSTHSPTELDQLQKQIKSKGDEIRKLKENGIDKVSLAPHIEELIALKAKLPELETIEKPKNERETTKQKHKEQIKNSKSPPAAQKVIEQLSESELRLARLAKVESMRSAGVEPFAYTFETTHTALQLAQLYENKLENGQEDESAHVSVAGRILTRRVFGKLAFFTMQDETGSIQLQFDKSRLPDQDFQVIKVCNNTIESDSTSLSSPMPSHHVGQTHFFYRSVSKTGRMVETLLA